MKTVLIINHDKVKCGTFQYAKRIYNIVVPSKDINYVYSEIHSRDEYVKTMYEINPDYVVYNWHKDRINWLEQGDILNYRTTRHYFLFHDGSIFSAYHKYLFCGEYPNQPCSIKDEDRILLPRPILQYDGGYSHNSVPTIGSFGFATDHKQFPELVSMVNRTFDKAHIRLHITSPYFGVTEGYNLPKIVAQCRASNINPNVKLTISSNFVDDETLLYFLAENDVNVFNYAYMNNPGISSAIDYALSVRRPFAVTNNSLFRHVANNYTLLEKNSIRQIIDRGIAPFEEFYKKWNPDEFRKQFDGMFQ